jgi:hypothetical protein
MLSAAQMLEQQIEYLGNIYLKEYLILLSLINVDKA